MDLKTLDDLYRYNRWANARVLDTAATLGRTPPSGDLLVFYDEGGR